MRPCMPLRKKAGTFLWTTIRGSGLAVLAIHGGKIERHTDVLARDIAGIDFSFYVLTGQRSSGNKRFLHVASERYEEPRVLAVLDGARYVVSLHGAADATQPFVMVGGLDQTLGSNIAQSLQAAGFQVRHPPRRLAGGLEKNICNRGSRRRGSVGDQRRFHLPDAAHLPYTQYFFLSAH